jgi:cellulose synthase/poly-beta-1,6-N-acetylglucosamine synthase-like glycosyltransferase
LDGAGERNASGARPSPFSCKILAFVNGFGAVLFSLYAIVLAPLALLGVHRAWLVWRSRGRSKVRERVEERPLAAWPRVTVQAPLYNERFVAARLVDALAALRYPSPILIQILDDSDDDTTEIVAHAIERARARGVSIDHIRRGARGGFKAGALAEGFARTDAELIAIFDADFVPPPDFLERIIPRFDDANVGMVQARWGHLNASQNELTRVQALLLDGHFVVEQRARAAAGCFFNFNGTAGVWRRACIEDAGGWQSDTVTEDLDLSYRAELAGWRFVYDGDVVAPAELPSSMGAFKRQQRRWSKGAIETARKLLSRVWRARQPVRVKREATTHLLSSLSYLWMAALTVLLPLTVWLRAREAAPLLTLLETVALVLGTGSVVLFYVAAHRRAATPGTGALAYRLLAVMAMGAGISLSNAKGVVEALIGRRTGFERTPKSGSASHAGSSYVVPRSSSWAFELGAALYLAAGVAVALVEHIWTALPFLTLFCAGYAWVAVASLRGAVSARKVVTSLSSCE